MFNSIIFKKLKRELSLDASIDYLHEDPRVKPRPANNTPGFLLPSAIRQIILAPRNGVSVRGTYRLRISTINQRPC